MMSTLATWFGLALLLLGSWAASAQAWAATASAVPTGPVVVTTIDGAIGPATVDHIRRALVLAAAQHAPLVVLRIDTPGGLDTSMRSIIKDILASPVPVASFVAPNGARAASAGTYILYASHVAAMAPASNLGAATPVAIGLPMPGGAPDAAAPAASGATPAHENGGDVMSAKRLADASAYIRSLAQLRGRNADWAEKAVRESVSLSAQEALKLHVVDAIAEDVPDLLRRLDGREIAMAGGAVRLETAGAAVQSFEADWRSRLLAVITDPSLALILMLVGIYGLLFEFSNPGFVLPGVAGSICLLLALFGLQMLPVNYAGLGLVLLGVAFFVAEVFLPSGALGTGGVIALVSGAVLLIDSDSPGFGIPPTVIAGVALASAGFVALVAGMAAKARRRPVVSGTPALLGATGELVEFAGGEGWALVQGEHWRVAATAALQPGETVRVTGARGSRLEVASAAGAPPTTATATTGA